MSLSRTEIITTCCIIAVRVRLINAYRAIGSYRRSKHTKSTTSLKPAAETNNFNPNFRQLRTNGPSMSAAQSTAVHDGLLHPHLRHCSSPASDLRSAGCHQLFVPRHRRSMFGRRAFSVAGPAACNSLPDYLRDLSCLTVFAAT